VVPIEDFSVSRNYETLGGMVLFDRKGVKVIQIHLNNVTLKSRERAYKRSIKWRDRG